MTEESKTFYTAETLFDKLFPAMEQAEPCAERALWIERYASRTVGEAIAELAANPEYGTSGFPFVLNTFGKYLDTNLRKQLISPIKDPMTAFRLYLDLVWLTDEEDRLLEAKFRGKLPRAEGELKDGIVKRVK